MERKREHEMETGIQQGPFQELGGHFKGAAGDSIGLYRSLRFTGVIHTGLKWAL